MSFIKKIFEDKSKCFFFYFLSSDQSAFISTIFIIVNKYI